MWGRGPSSPHRVHPGRTLTIAAALTAVTLVAGVAAQNGSNPAPAVQPAVSPEEQQARVTCGGCHAVPPPDILPKAQWRDEFLKMMYLRENRLPPLGPPEVTRLAPLPDDMRKVLPHYESRAPEHLPMPAAWPPASESPVHFVKHPFSLPSTRDQPAVSNVRLGDFDGDGHIEMLATEMRVGLVLKANPSDASGTLSVLATAPHPDHVTPVDLDKDGILDLLVADLGEFFPEDHDKGAVIWMRGLGNWKFSPFWLDGWPRVADVEAADFNGDGKLDLAVAAFGYHKTGNISILENQITNPNQPAFKTHVIDPRTGAIHIIPIDLNKDGHMDFVVLLAQEHETVIAFINRGTGDFTFDQQVIYIAPHPNWGSSGIQLVDLDKDGDLDVILTHGDTFDDGIVKPYHGIQWLENTGTYPFVEHRLADMPGVHRAIATDLDGDGDLDIVAGALLAGGADVDESVLPALVWLEQTTPGTFVRHTIETGFPRHASLDVADIDGDGDIDIVAGNFSANRPVSSWIDVWENQLKRAKQ